MCLAVTKSWIYRGAQHTPRATIVILPVDTSWQSSCDHLLCLRPATSRQRPAAGRCVRAIWKKNRAKRRRQLRVQWRTRGHRFLFDEGGAVRVFAAVAVGIRCCCWQHASTKLIISASLAPLFIVVTRILRQRSKYHIKDTHFVSWCRHFQLTCLCCFSVGKLWRCCFGLKSEEPCCWCPPGCF